MASGAQRDDRVHGIVPRVFVTTIVRMVRLERRSFLTLTGITILALPMVTLEHLETHFLPTNILKFLLVGVACRPPLLILQLSQFILILHRISHLLRPGW